VIWDLRSAGLRPDGFTSADAAGLPVFPGLARLDQVRRGAIEHAIRVTFESTRDAWIHPASHCAGDTSDPDAPPMGLRMRLRGSYDLSGFSGAARVIALALKRYGLITADNGSNWFFSGTSDHRWDDDNLNQLKSIPGSAFEVVRSAAPVHVC
jgi:3-oxoacyl-(acyl-carrier-protein) synthase